MFQQCPADYRCARFKWTKQVASHFGGTRQRMAISWPGHISDVGGMRSQFHHMIDIVPTILEAGGIPAPDMVNGIKQKPIEGVSMAYTFDKANANAPSKRDTQYFEMFGNRAIYHDGWIGATPPPAPLGPLELARCPASTIITGNSITSRKTTPRATTLERRCRISSRKCRLCS
jgi:arylsulfatase A-like enzyme